jgi:hypothetical protein
MVFNKVTKQNTHKRKVIIHKHLFKNAGTTFDWSLSKNYGEGFYDHRDDKLMRQQGEPYLLNFLNEHPTIKALSSHHIWFRFSKNNDIELIPVYLLRHPIERIKSVYKFERIQQSDTHGAIMAKKLTFKEYVKWRMSSESNATIRNFQTRYLSGIKGGKDLTNFHFEKALAELETCSFVGVVDRYDDSMKLFEYEFKKIGIDIDLTYTPQNVTQSVKNIDVDDRVNQILGELGDMLSKEVLEKNKFDVEIYNIAKIKLINKLNSYRLVN